MALQLLNRNFAGLGGYEKPKILKLPHNEERWSPKRTPVDIGDVMMNVRMNNGKNRYIQEHVSKYSQGLNPYGETGYPYKVNKQFRPPIIDPKFYEPLSRMPVKFDQITAGPIVKSLYEKQIEIGKVAPKTIIDRVCPDAETNPSLNIQTSNQVNRNHELQNKQPKPSIPYWPSLPVHLNTGVPSVELDPQMIVRPNMGIHYPFQISDQSRDVHNMRTPMHVAVQPGYKDPYTTVDLRPDPSMIYGITQTPCNASGRTNMTWVNQEADRGITKLDDPLHAGEFTGKAQVPTIDNHPSFNRARNVTKVEHFTPLSHTPNFQQTMSGVGPVGSCIKTPLQLQQARVERRGVQQN